MATIKLEWSVRVRDITDMREEDVYYLTGEVDIRYSDVLQGALGKSNGLDLVGIGIRIVDRSALGVGRLVQVARLDDDSAQREDVAPSLVSWVDPDGFVAEAKHRLPISQGVRGLGVDVTGINTEVVRSGQVPPVKRQICVKVGRRYPGWVCLVWVHDEIRRV